MAASWSAVGRACVRGFGGQGLIGRHPGGLSLPSTVACATIEAGRHHSELVSKAGEKVTHTGQIFDDSDYRRIRFVGKQKEVNEQFAINLVADQPVNEAESRIVSCDGGGGALGHPKVYINLDKETKTGTCGYCGLQFTQKHHH